jgi:hypothetical protein
MSKLVGDLDDLIAGYFADYRRIARSSKGRLSEQDDRLSDWLTEALEGRTGQVDAAWDVILELVARAPDNGALAFVAAGPLEDLVRRWGTHFEDRLIAHTRDDPRFRMAMQCVWGWEDVRPDLREHLLRLRGPAL